MLAIPLFAFLQADAGPALVKWMDAIGQKQLDARAEVIASLRTPAQAAERQKAVRAKVLELIGGLPDYEGPLNARATGSIDAGRYTIEKLVFESLPKYYVTANLYVPKTPGPHPGVLFALGHWEQGKPAGQLIAGNLALKGFVVLAYDPMGQGERLQGYDPRTGAAIAGGSVNQHLLAGAQSILIGESYARYHIWDAKRAVDYLVSRPEVDGNRIGATGCSGGGTITTYIAALDQRIKVAAPACYTNSWRKLLSGPTGDSEQTFAGFVAAGLDMADYPESFAPKPWLMASTEEDFFTPEGARIVYEEARRWYEMLGVPERVKWVVGPGRHGTPLVVRQAIYEWMQRWLDGGRGKPDEEAVELLPDFRFQATKSGQVSTEFNSVEVYSFIRSRYEALKKPADPAAFRAWIRAGVDYKPNVSVERKGETIALHRPDGMTIQGKLTIPAQAQRLPATLFVGYKYLPEAPGNVVLALETRGAPAILAEELPGDWINNERALVVGRSLPLLRAADILAGVEQLTGMPEVDPARIRVVARDVAGIWALFAAAADSRIAKLELNRVPYDFRSALDSPVSRNLHEAVVPGLLLRGDLPDLVKAMEPSRVVWRDPVNWMRNVVALEGYTYSTFVH